MDHRGSIILSGNSHPELAKSVARHLDVKLGKSSAYQKTNKETVVEIQESVRGKDVYIIQTGTKDVNNSIMELLIMCYACKTSSCKNVIGVLPYLPYCRHTKMRRRGNISLKLVAQMLGKAGFSHIITLDMHSKESQGFFDCAIDNLRASPFLIQYIQESIPDWNNAVIVAKNPLVAKRASSYAERLRIGIAFMHGEVKEDEEEEDGRASPPPNDPNDQDQQQEGNPQGQPAQPQQTADASADATAAASAATAAEEQSISDRVTQMGVTMPPMTPKEKPPINVVGDVSGRIAIMVDDIIDDVQSFVNAAAVLKERGAYKIYVMATHGILSKEAPRLIEDSAIDEVVVTNSVPHDVQKLQCHKIKTVDISILLAEAIRRIHNKESMSHLFRHVRLED